MKVALIIAGFVLEAFGLLFLLQGAGVVRWPASSFMIDQTMWIVIGGIMVVAGGLLYVTALKSRA